MDQVASSASSDTNQEPPVWPHPDGGYVQLIETPVHKCRCSMAFDAMYGGACIGYVVFLGEAVDCQFKDGTPLWSSTKNYQQWCDVTDMPDLIRYFILGIPPTSPVC